MARLANDRNEMYCKHRAKGMIPSKAALAAGYAQGSSTTHLEQDGEIVARIAELKDEYDAQRAAQRAAAIAAAQVVGQLTGVTRSWVITKLAENAQLAQQAEDFKESNHALELIGKDFGMFSGGSEEEEPGAVPRTLDYDKLTAVLDSAHEALPDTTLTDPSREFSSDMAMSLIEGQTKKLNMARERELSTGSETDIALTAEVLPEASDMPDLEDPA